MAPDAYGLYVTDDGDLLLVNSLELPLRLVLGGPVETTSLGDSAAVSAITREHYLCSEKGNRTVVRLMNGGLLYAKKDSLTVFKWRMSADQARSLDRPGAELTWRFLTGSGGPSWRLTLVAADESLLWVDGGGLDDIVNAPRAAAAPDAPAAVGASACCSAVPDTARPCRGCRAAGSGCLR